MCYCQGPCNWRSVAGCIGPSRSFFQGGYSLLSVLRRHKVGEPSKCSRKCMLRWWHQVTIHSPHPTRCICTQNYPRRAVAGVEARCQVTGWHTCAVGPSPAEGDLGGCALGAHAILAFPGALRGRCGLVPSTCFVPVIFIAGCIWGDWEATIVCNK